MYQIWYVNIGAYTHPCSVSVRRALFAKTLAVVHKRRFVVCVIHWKPFRRYSYAVCDIHRMNYTYEYIHEYIYMKYNKEYNAVCGKSRWCLEQLES